MALVSFRMLFGTLTAAAITVYQKAPWPHDLKTWLKFAILGPINLAIPIFLISWGERTIDSAVASILNATVPLFTIIIAHFWLTDDKITFQKALGLLVGFGGVVVLLSRDLASRSDSSALGQGAVILGAVFYAVGTVFARQFTQHVIGPARGAAPLITATLFIWIVAPIFEKPFKFPALPITWIAALWLGILGSAVAWIMFYYLLHAIGPTRASLVTYLFPIGGVFFGMFFLHEQLTGQLLTGAILIIASVVVVNWKPVEKAELKQVVAEPE